MTGPIGKASQEQEHIQGDHEFLRWKHQGRKRCEVATMLMGDQLEKKKNKLARPNHYPVGVLTWGETEANHQAVVAMEEHELEEPGLNKESVQEHLPTGQILMWLAV